EGLSDELPEALEAVTRLGLRKLEKVLKVPLDVSDPSLTRSQVTAAGIAINAQLRADEARLKAKASEDVLGRLLDAIEKERKRQAPDEANGRGTTPAPRKPFGAGGRA